MPWSRQAIKESREMLVTNGVSLWQTKHALIGFRGLLRTSNSLRKNGPSVSPGREQLQGDMSLRRTSIGLP